MTKTVRYFLALLLSLYAAQSISVCAPKDLPSPSHADERQNIKQSPPGLVNRAKLYLGRAAKWSWNHKKKLGLLAVASLLAYYGWRAMGVPYKRPESEMRKIEELKKGLDP